MNKAVIVAAVMAGMLASGSALANWDNNPGFETSYTNSWFSFDPSITSNSSEFAHLGALSLKFDTPDIAEDDVPGGNLPSYTVIDHPHNAATPGGTFTASAFYYVDDALVNHEALGIGLFWLDNVGTPIGGEWTTVFGPEVVTGGPNFPIGEEIVGNWTEISVVSTAPATAAFMQVALEVTGDGSSVFFDDVIVIPEPSSLLLLGMGLTVVAIVRRKQSLRYSS